VNQRWPGRNARLRPTPLHRAFPQTGEFTALAAAFSADAVNEMLALVWRGFDRLCRDFGLVIASLDDRQIERSITSALESYMSLERDPMTAYHTKHEAWEMETAESDGAHPPAYDIAFVLNANFRVMWPLEAKLLRTDRQVADYVNDLRGNMLTGRYAPFSKSAGMLGYLLSGQAIVAVKAIEAQLSVALLPYPLFHPKREHYLSYHERNLEHLEDICDIFDCHHLIMSMVMAPDVLSPASPAETPT
jgi:hypothetical protein